MPRVLRHLRRGKLIHKEAEKHTQSHEARSCDLKPALLFLGILLGAVMVAIGYQFDRI